MLCWKQTKQNKNNVDYISSAEDNWEVIYSLPFHKTKTIISALAEKNLFSSPSGFTHLVSLIWKGIWLVQLL